MSNIIGIVMGGYVDENYKLLDRRELNKRIASIQVENKKLKINRSRSICHECGNKAMDMVGAKMQDQIDSYKIICSQIWEYWKGKTHRHDKFAELLGEIDQLLKEEWQ